MKKGFRVAPQPSKNEAMNELKAEFANLQMAGRVSQMMVQQLMQSLKNVSEDLSASINQLYELQYKYNALSKHLNVDEKAVANIANAQRLLDFNEAAAKQDIQDNLGAADVVSAESTIVITSTAADEKGIFRSRLKLSESGVPDLIKGLEGKRVGDKITVTLNNVLHEVELLDIKNPQYVAEEAAPTTETIQ